MMHQLRPGSGDNCSLGSSIPLFLSSVTLCWWRTLCGHWRNYSSLFLFEVSVSGAQGDQMTLRRLVRALVSVQMLWQPLVPRDSCGTVTLSLAAR